MTEAHAVHSDASKLKYVTMLTKQKYLFSRHLKLREIDLRLLNWDSSIQIKLNGVSQGWNPHVRINREEKS